MGMMCKDMDGLDGEGAVGLWMGWDGKDGIGKGKGKEREGKEECYLGSACSPLTHFTRSIY